MSGYGDYGRCGFRRVVLQGVKEEGSGAAGGDLCVGGAVGERMRMSANDETVYIKIDQNVLVFDRHITIGDIAAVTSSNETMVRKIRQKKFYSFSPPPASKKNVKVQREIFSVLKVVELIHEEFPNAEIQNEGESDFIL